MTSVAFNLEMEDMLAYTGNNTLYIKTQTLPAMSQPMIGFVVGFKGSKIFSLQQSAMNTIDVPQSQTFYRFLDNKNFDMAYKIGCLGVTEQDWRALGTEALKAANFDMAQRAFIRIRDMKFLDLCEKAQMEHKRRLLNENLLQGDICAYLGKYQEASVAYMKNGTPERALDMYTALKQFEKAQGVLKNADRYQKGSGKGMSISQDLMVSQAQHELEMNNWKGAAELYENAAMHKEAIDIYGKRGVLDKIMEICRKLDPKTHKAEVEICARYFRQAQHHTFAKQALMKLGDTKQLMGLHIELHKWEEAFELAKKNP